MTFSKRRIFASVAALFAATIAFSTCAETNKLGNAPPLEAYGNLPAISHIDLSPSGTHVAMVMRKGAESYVVDYDVASQAVETQPIGKLIVNSLSWVDDEYLTFTSRQGLHSGETQTVLQGLVLNIRNHKSYPLSGTGRYQSTVLYDLPTTVTKNNRKIIYQLMRESSAGDLVGGGGIKLFSVTPATGELSEINSDVPVYSILMKPDGTFIAGPEYKYDQKIWRLKFNIDGNWKTAFEQTGRLDLPSMGGLGRDGKSVVLFMNDGDLKGNYYEVSSDGAFSEPLNPGQNYSSAVYHPKTNILSGFANHDDWISYRFYDPVMKALPALAAKAFGDYRTSFESFAEDPRKTIVYTEGADDAGTYFFVDFTNGSYTQIGLAYPDLPPEWIAEKKLITYKAADGLEIHAYLTLPPGRAAKDLPLIVMPHGGPEARDDLSFSYKAQALASRGYAVLQPNFRGSDGYGLAFNEKGYGEWGRKMQTDLSDGAKYLASQGIINSKRVCIVGASYGGYAALAGAAFDGPSYRCAVSVSGISDLNEFLNWKIHDSYGENSGTSLYWKRLLGDLTLLDNYSPVQHVDKINIPILLIHGKDDTTVQLKQSQIMLKAMNAAGKQVEFVELNGEDHYMSTSENRLKSLTTIVDFLLKNNPPY